MPQPFTHMEKHFNFTVQALGDCVCLCVCLPDSLGIEAGHGPHQGATPVVTHQGDLWYGLEQGTISFCVNFKLSCYSMTVLILTILSKNTTNSWKREKNMIQKNILKQH